MMETTSSSEAEAIILPIFQREELRPGEVETLTLNHIAGTSLVVQWLRFYAFTAGGKGLIPSWGTKIP